jgi:hypothetical protein
MVVSFCSDPPSLPFQLCSLLQVNTLVRTRQARQCSRVRWPAFYCTNFTYAYTIYTLSIWRPCTPKSDYRVLHIVASLNTFWPSFGICENITLVTTRSSTFTHPIAMQIQDMHTLRSIGEGEDGSSSSNSIGCDLSPPMKCQVLKLACQPFLGRG